MQAHGMPNEKVHQLRALGENLIQVKGLANQFKAKTNFHFSW